MKAQQKRIDNAFKQFDDDHKDVDSPVIDTLIAENNTLYTGCKEGPVRDAAIIIALQRIKHYEIATYGSIIALAKAENLQKIASIFEPSLDEAYECDKTLSDMATNFINVNAVYANKAA